MSYPARAEGLGKYGELNSMAENSILCPIGRNSIVCLHGPISNPQLQLSASMADNPTVCLQGLKSTPNGLFFQNLQILRTIASGHDVIHTPASFPIWSLLWQLWLSYPLHASINCTQYLCTWTKSQIVQSPTKLNDKL